MAESAAKIRLTLDGQQLVEQLDRVDKSVSGIGDKIAGGWGRGLLSATLGFGAIVSAARKLNDELNDIEQRRINSQRAAGASALSFDTFAASRKLTGAQARQLQAELSGGVRTEDEGIKFIGGLDRRVGPDAMRGLLRAYQSGLYTDEEMKRFERRRYAPTEAAMRDRYTSLSPVAQSELARMREAAEGDRDSRLGATYANPSLIDARAAEMVKRYEDRDLGLFDRLIFKSTSTRTLLDEARRAQMEADPERFGALDQSAVAYGGATGPAAQRMSVFREWAKQAADQNRTNAKISDAMNKPQAGGQQ